MRGAVVAAAILGALVLAPSLAQGGPAPTRVAVARAAPHCFHDSPGSPCTYWCDELVGTAVLRVPLQDQEVRPVPRRFAPQPRCDRSPNPHGVLRFASGR
jgi:hypothetical protein